MAEPPPPTVLDWHTHPVGSGRAPNRGYEPCRICDQPALMRDDTGRPCHKVCAEGGHRPATPAARVVQPSAPAPPAPPVGVCCRTGPTRLACALCPASPTYWRRPGRAGAAA